METSPQVARTATVHRAITGMTGTYSSFHVVPDSVRGLAPKRQKKSTENEALPHEIRCNNNDNEGNVDANGSVCVIRTGTKIIDVDDTEPNGSSQTAESEENEVVVESDEVEDDDDRPVKSGIVNGWFHEWIEFSCGGHAVYLKIDEILFHERSPYQDILVFKSSTYGNVLVLDGIINCTERDEFAYQEMMTHLALCSHPDPQSVLIIGGGDGGVAREVAKHDVVKRIVQCEIDGVEKTRQKCRIHVADAAHTMVVEACKKFIPSMAQGFNDERVELIIGDGFAFIDEHINEFDVIITDSSDPEGPAETLFGSEYYRRMYHALKPNGLLLSQGQTMWIQKEVDAITPLLRQLRQIFAVVDYAYTFIPTYTMGQIGFIMASKNPETKFDEPLRILSEDQLRKMNLRYYNPDMHRASFVMPQFIRKILPV